MNNSNYYDVVTPIELDNGKTIWHKIGTAFPNHDPNKKHAMVISIVSIPLSAMACGEIKLFVFPQDSRRHTSRSDSPPSFDDDVSF